MHFNACIWVVVCVYLGMRECVQFCRRLFCSTHNPAAVCGEDVRLIIYLSCYTDVELPPGGRSEDDK